MTKKNEPEKPEPAALAPVPKAALPAAPPAPINTQVEGLDDVMPEQVEVPLLVQVQGTSKNVGDARIGDWYMRSTGRSYGQRVRLVPIAKFDTRGYFIQNEPTPQCLSIDGRVPLGGKSPASPLGKTSTTCADCYFAERQPDPKNPRKRLPAPCAAQINFLALVGDEEDPPDEWRLCRVRFKRTSWQVGRDIVSNAQFSANRVKTLWGIVYQLWTAKIEENALGKYAVPAVKELGLTAVVQPELEERARAYSAIWKTTRERIAKESMTPDEDPGEAQEVEPAPVQTVATPSSGNVPKDDLPF